MSGMEERRERRSMMYEPHKCPRCKGDAVVIKGTSGNRWHACCNKFTSSKSICPLYGGYGDWHDSPEEAILAWNLQVEKEWFLGTEALA